MVVTPQDPKAWQLRHGKLELRAPLIMGILNITPDSFSDGGRYHDPQKAVERAWQIIEEGAHILDIGGESTRPGAVPVAPEEEWQRIQPVLKQVAARTKIPVSVDTRRAEIARRSLDEGAQIINDVSGGGDPAMFPVAAKSACGFVLVHSRGEPASMMQQAHYQDVVQEVRDELVQSLNRALSLGLQRQNICLDPGFGFAKNPEQNRRLLEGIESIRTLGYPVLAGLSRKSMLKAIVGDGEDELKSASHTGALIAYCRGARIFRVHDVKASLAAFKTFQALADRIPS